MLPDRAFDRAPHVRQVCSLTGTSSLDPKVSVHVSPTWKISAPPVSRQSSQTSLSERLLPLETTPLSGRMMGVSSIVEAGSMSFRPRSVAFQRMLSPGREDEQVPISELCWWVLFGASGWWSCNSIFSELPLLQAQSPAGKKLGSQLSMMTQLGNSFLITFKAVEHRLELDAKKALHIHLMMAVALLLLVFCSLSWHIVALDTNLPLLVFMAFAGGVGCMSSATYWPIMIGFPPICTKAMGVGFSTGGVMATLLAALQMGGCGDGGPRWGVGAYFAASACCQACLWLVAAKQLGHLQDLLALLPPVRQARAQEAAKMLLDLQDRPGELLPTTLAARGQRGRRRASSVDSSSLLAETGAHTVLPGDLLKACNFCIHAAVYSVPSMLPFVAGGYPKHVEQQAILWMLVSQQCGETLGRLTAPVTDVRTLPAAAAATVAGVWLCFLAAALSPAVLASLVPTWLAVPVLAVSCFSCYFSFGILQTVLFVWARSAENAAALSSNVGFLGQCGSLFGCFAVWLSVNELALFGG